MKTTHPLARPLLAWLRRFSPASLTIPTVERWRIVAGAALGILLTGLLSQWLSPAATTWLIAPIGASAVLVFGVPSSPMAQPWSVVGGNTLSALIGTACAMLIPDTTLAAALAVSIAIGAMMLARCLHPPGGAAALLVVLSHHPSWSFVAFPILCNSLLLVLLGVAFNSLTGRSYPHRHAVESEAPEPANANRFSRADLNAALQYYNQVLDVDPDDLVELLQHAEAAAYQRTLGELRCQDVMTRNPKAVEFGTELGDAWALMRVHQIKALPVVDRARRVVGIVTVADFLNHARLDDHTGLAGRMQAMLRPSKLTHSERPEVVGQIMTRQVRVMSAHRHAVELLPLFSEAGHHHLPIIDPENRLVGILTQSDLLRALSNAVKPSAAG
jgi:CBS domain-containing membrane protein